MLERKARAPARRHLWLAVCAALGSGAHAQQAPGQGESEAALEEVTVTGSRIRRTGMTTPTPVTLMRSEELDSMAPGNMVDGLSQVPQFLNNETPNTAASKGDSAGAANLNLRGISAKRTLVLLNGRRVVPSNRLGNVDINLFPEAAVERVEVVTGGASAAYGTDAVAGVVNFILDDEFEGLSAHAQSGVTSRSDYDNYEVSVTGGTSIGERMHVVASADYYEHDRIDHLGAREWFEGEGLVTNPEWIESGGEVGPRLLVRKNVVSTSYTDGGLIDAPGSAIDRLMFLDDGSPVPFALGDPAVVGTGTQSQSITERGAGFNPSWPDLTVSTPAYPDGTRTGSFVPDTERSSGFVHFDYDVSDRLTLYAQGLYGHNEINTVGTLPIGNGSRAGTIYRENAYLPESIRQTMEAEGLDSFLLQRYHTAHDLGQDRFVMENDTTSFTAGFDLDIEGGAFEGWQVNGYFQAGRNDNQIHLIDNIRRDRLPLAMDAVRDPDSGAIVCNVTLVNPGSQYDDCVPINLFGTGNASWEAINWVLDDMFIDANTEQDNAEVSASGDVFDDRDAGAVSLAFGASYREQSIEHLLGPESIDALDVPVNDPAAGIRGIPPAWAGVDDVLQFVDLEEYAGSFDVKEVFAESLVPLVSGGSLAQQLDLSLSARWADYEGSGSIWAWKTGLDWQATTDLRFRGTVSRDIRAGSLEERFDRQGQAANVDDPELDNLTYTAFQIRGGNPQVNPEEADTLTFGAVYQPSGVDGLSLSLDWYDIEVNKAIDLLGVQRIVDQCFNEGGEICNRITRDPDSGRVTRVENTFLNLNTLNANGVDLEATYNRQLDLFGGGAETLGFRFLGSWLNEHSFTNVDAPKVDQVGELSGAGYPEFRATTNVTYSNGPFSAFLQGRYIDSGILDIDYVEGVDIADNSVSSVFYTDLRLSYGSELSGDREWEVFLNVTNLFDEDPPLVPTWSAFTGTNFSANLGLHDLLGRRYTGGLQVRF